MIRTGKTDVFEKNLKKSKKFFAALPGLLLCLCGKGQQLERISAAAAIPGAAAMVRPESDPPGRVLTV